ncbi:MAG: aminotransferase class III-fold pyridoxal phosphate-dependent enzyme [Armatimonadetes bacterium]|nr:aminotransferase class III-fold pyridoxal phosphate-dependent enzyme [Armatimonadota bacterium]
MSTELLIEETVELYKRHLNPTLPNLIRFMGFGTILESGEGAILRDVEGNEWLDFLGGLGVFNVGHRHPRVMAAVRAQLERLPLNVPVFFNRPAAELAAELAAITPGRLQYTFFCTSGTEAVEGALKLARVATGRQEIVSAHRAFHGKTFGSLSASGREIYKEPFQPLLPGFRQVPFGDGDALAEAVSSRTAAVLLEPIQGEGGVILPPDDYLGRAREICDRHGALLILDEVQTGLGRTGRMFAAEHYGVAPDLMCLAKALGGGVMPLGAICGTPEVWEPLGPNPWLHTSTFGSPGGNPLACAAGLAAVRVLQEERLPERAADLGRYLLGQLRAVQAEYPSALREVRGRGLLVGIEFEDEDVAGLTIAGIARRRVIAAYYLSNPRVFRFEPPLVVTRAQIDRAVTAFREALAEALALLAESDAPES